MRLNTFIRSGWFCTILLLVACQTVPAPKPTATPVPTVVMMPQSRIGRPVKSETSGSVYRLMENNHLRHITDLLTLSALAYDWRDVVTIPQSELTSYEVDPPLSRWLTGKTDTGLYYLQRGTRYKITADELLQITNGLSANVSQVEDTFLHSFPLSDVPLEAANSRYVKVGTSGTADSVKGILANLALTNPLDAVWTADPSYYDVAQMRYHIGRGLIHQQTDRTEQVLTLNNTDNDPLKHITAIQEDTAHEKLWIGTSFAGLLSYDLKAKTWQHFTEFDSPIRSNRINALQLAADGSVWLAMPSGVQHFNGTDWQSYGIPDDVTPTGALSLVIAQDVIWVCGENFIAKIDTVDPDGKLQNFSAFDHPFFLDRFGAAQLDDKDGVRFTGNNRLITYATDQWTAYDITTGKSEKFDPATPRLADIPAFPDPTKDYTAWLKTWPRPDHDNGRGIHYLAFPSGDRFELEQQVQRMKRLNIRWVLLNYTSRTQLLQMAPVFKEAGIMVIWRPWVRPYVEYKYWKQDVTFLRALGIPPYMQIYNEPSLGQEWEDQGKPIDQELYLTHLIPAMRQVYDAGGYVGLQHIDLNWLRTTLQRMKDKQMLDILPRFFFIPHAYGYNHPPEFDADENSVLGFRFFAQVFYEEIGFVPMMIAGEGGWRPDEGQDIRYPIVTQTRYRDYMVAVLKWFQTGKLSNGEPLPDYFLAFCPWIISDPNDRAAWFDSIQGNRELVIQGVENLPPFERHFSWDKLPPEPETF